MTPTTDENGANWSLYVLRCGDGSLYTGISPAVEARLQAHEAGRGARYLRGRTPLTLLAQVEVGTRAAASRVEYAFKRLRRADKQRWLDSTGGLALFVLEQRPRGAAMI